MKTVSTTAGAGVVQSGFQIVVAQKPIERSPSLSAPTLISGRAMSLQASRDGRAGFYWLLIEPGFSAAFAIEAERADGDKVSVNGAVLLFFQPLQ
jgi:hypothetical protein